MPMNGTVLGTAIMDALISGGVASESAQARQAWLIAANQIVAHIIANAAVNVNVASVTAVTPGVGVSGPGTGTGTIT